MKNESFESRAERLLRRFDPDDERKRLLERPFMIELFGTPKSGKSTMKEMLKHVFKRNGWSVSAPTEGAEVVEWIKRREPDYNLQTAEYALSRARELAYGPVGCGFHVAIFDRAVMDGVVRMDHYEHKSVITPEQRGTIEDYLLLPHHRQLFDLHVCLVASPEVAIERELAHAISRKHGETMNPRTLAELLETHRRVWTRLNLDRDRSMCWHDSSKEDKQQTGLALLRQVLNVFGRRLSSLDR